jgi:hypothetical protein
MTPSLATALALILSIETTDMNPLAVGDLHLRVEDRAYGRMGMRSIMLRDLDLLLPLDNGQRWTRANSQDPELDILMTAAWLNFRAGENASVRRYMGVWNAGPSQWRNAQGAAYYRRALKRKAERPGHFRKCVEEVKRVTKQKERWE